MFMKQVQLLQLWVLLPAAVVGFVRIEKIPSRRLCTMLSVQRTPRSPTDSFQGFKGFEREKYVSPGERKRDAAQKERSRFMDRNGREKFIDQNGRERFVDQSGTEMFGRNRFVDPNGRNRFVDPNVRNRFVDPNGRNRFVDPNGRNQFGDPRGRNQFDDPRGRNRFVDPRERNRFFDPNGRNQFGDPRGRNRFVDPRGRNRFVDPRERNRFLDPNGRNQFGDPRGRNRFVDPNGRNRFVDPNGRNRFVDPNGRDDRNGRYVGVDRNGRYGFIDPNQRNRFLDRNGRNAFPDQNGRIDFLERYGFLERNGSFGGVDRNRRTDYVRQPEIRGRFDNGNGSYGGVDRNGRTHFVNQRDKKERFVDPIRNYGGVDRNGRTHSVDQHSKETFVDPNRNLGDTDRNGRKEFAGQRNPKESFVDPNRNFGGVDQNGRTDFVDQPEWNGFRDHNGKDEFFDEPERDGFFDQFERDRFMDRPERNGFIGNWFVDLPESEMVADQPGRKRSVDQPERERSVNQKQIDKFDDEYARTVEPAGQLSVPTSRNDDDQPADSKRAFADVDNALQAIPFTPWEDIRSQLESMQTPEERAFRDNLETGYGEGSPLQTLRLYSSENRRQNVRVKLYRDSAAWCPYCQMVWMTLEEKRIPYEVELINMKSYGEKSRNFTIDIQSSGNLPATIIDGQTYGKPNEILFALEQAFPNHKSLEPPTEYEELAKNYNRLERQLYSAWMYWIAINDGGGGAAKRGFVDTLLTVEDGLDNNTPGPFFLGEEVSDVDIMFAPFLERMAASLAYFKGYLIRVTKGTKTDFPALNRWFDAMELLPSYQVTKSDYYTHCWNLPTQLGGCTSEKDGKDYEDAINGIRALDGTQGSWELPLQVDNGGVEPDWEWAGDDVAACREAVERITANYEEIVKYASRGAGEMGTPEYQAPLSDPNAVPREEVQPLVDQILRLVCMAMLHGVDDRFENILSETASIIGKVPGGKHYATAVIASLAYLRDRVGVPRDMRLPAARQLRAHLNWAIGLILDAT